MCFQQQGLLAMSDYRLIGVSIQVLQTGSPSSFLVMTPGVGDGQGGLACCDSWGRKESDMTERLN